MQTAFLAGQHRDTLWEKAYMLVGMENLMVYFKTEPEAVHEDTGSGRLDWRTRKIGQILSAADKGDAILVFILAPGAFLCLGYLIALVNKLKKRMA